MMKILTVYHEILDDWLKSQLLAKMASNTSDETSIKTRLKHVTAVTKHFWNRFTRKTLS